MSIHIACSSMRIRAHGVFMSSRSIMAACIAVSMLCGMQVCRIVSFNSSVGYRSMALFLPCACRPAASMCMAMRAMTHCVAHGHCIAVEGHRRW